MKRLIPILLCLALVLSMLPVTASAANTYINKIEITGVYRPKAYTTVPTPAQLANVVKPYNSSGFTVTACWYTSEGVRMDDGSFEFGQNGTEISDYYLYVKCTAKSGYQFYQDGGGTVPFDIRGASSNDTPYKIEDVSTSGSTSSVREFKLWYMDEVLVDDAISPEILLPQALYAGSKAGSVKPTKAGSENWWWIDNDYADSGLYCDGVKLSANIFLRGGEVCTYRGRLRTSGYHSFCEDTVVYEYNSLGTAEVLSWDQSSLVYEFTFPPCKATIVNVDITGIDELNGGANPQRSGFQLSFHSLVLCGVKWFQKGSDTELTSADTFEKGRTYRLELDIKGKNEIYEAELNKSSVTVNRGTVTDIRYYSDWVAQTDTLEKHSIVCVELTATGSIDYNLGAYLYDMTRDDIGFNPNTEAQSRSLQQAWISGDVGKRTEGNDIYLDLDRDGSDDLVIFTRSGTKYLNAVSGTNLRGTYTLVLSETARAVLQADGKNYFGTLKFRFPAVGLDQGVFTIDMSSSGSCTLPKDDSALLTTLNEILDIYLPLTEDGFGWFEDGYDLDGDDFVDFAEYYNNGTITHYVNPWTNIRGSFVYSVPAAAIKAIEDFGLPYYSKIIWVFPALGADKGSFDIDLTGDGVLAAHDGEVFQSISNTFQAWAYYDMLSFSSQDNRIDLDNEGHYDLDAYAEGSNVLFARADTTNLSGDYALVMDDAMRIDMREVMGAPCFYSTRTFHFPERNQGSYTVDLSAGNLVLNRHSPEAQALYTTLVYLFEECGGVPEPIEDDSEGDFSEGQFYQSWDVNRDDVPDFVISGHDNEYVWIYICSGCTIKDPVTFTVPEGSESVILAYGSYYYSTLQFVFRDASRDQGSWTVDLRSGDRTITDTQIFNAIYTTMICAHLHDQINISIIKPNESRFDLDQDGVYDMRWAIAANNVYLAVLPDTNISGDFTLLLNQPLLDDLENGTANYYSEILFRFPNALTNPFVDVQEGKYYYEPVLWAFYHNPQVTNGTDATHFSPDKTCTRGQVVTFLWRANGCPEPTITSHPFKDVKNGAYYYKAMLWAVENDITAGTSATAFSPDKDCTRAQVVTFLWRTAGKPEPKTTSCPFTDVDAGAFYYKAMLWAVEEGITNGTSATTFGPGRSCTRGQVVTFLYRYMKG